MVTRATVWPALQVARALLCGDIAAHKDILVTTTVRSFALCGVLLGSGIAAVSLVLNLFNVSHASVAVT
jgi:hypothetical protein